MPAPAPAATKCKGWRFTTPFATAKRPDPCDTMVPGNVSKPGAMCLRVRLNGVARAKGGLRPVDLVVVAVVEPVPALARVQPRNAGKGELSTITRTMRRRKTMIKTTRKERGEMTIKQGS